MSERAGGTMQSRQPVHTVFGGAHLFRAGVASRFGALALESLDSYATDAGEFGAAFGIDSPAAAERLCARVRAKLREEPVEDYRIDFEDGYGVRADAEEDGHAAAAAHEVAAGIAARSLPWGTGIRVKSFAPGERARSGRTLRRFLAELVERAGGVPPNFVVNLPKATTVGQVADFARVLDECEREFRLPDWSIGLEVMVETPQLVLGADGRSLLPLLAEAGGPLTASGGAPGGAQDPAAPAAAAPAGTADARFAAALVAAAYSTIYLETARRQLAGEPTEPLLADHAARVRDACARPERAIASAG